MIAEINHPKVIQLAKELTNYTGETITQAIISALYDRLLQEQTKYQLAPHTLQEELLQIGKECAALPVLDDRTANEILGYNEKGLPS